MDIDLQAHLQAHAFFDSQSRFPLIWMCHSRKLYHKINRLHEKCLRIIFNDKTSSYEELLSKDGSASIHHNNVLKLVIDIYKVVNGLCTEIITVFQFQIQNHQNLRNNTTFRISSFNTIFKGKESVSYLLSYGTRQDEIKSFESITSFKKAIKKWVPQKCQYGHRRTF